MLKKSFILLAVMLCFVGRALAQDRTKLNYEKKLNIIRKRAGVDSITSLKILSIEHNYKLNVAALSLQTSLSDAELRKQIQLLIDKKNTELVKFLPKVALITYLPTSEGQRLDSSLTQNLLSRNSAIIQELKGDSDTSRNNAKLVRKRAVNEIAMSYSKKMDNIRKALPEGESKQAELEKLLAERNEKISRYLSEKGDSKNVKETNKGSKQKSIEKN